MFRHEPVLLKEAISYFDLKPGDRVIDGTVGGGGHSRMILEAIGPNGKLLGFDQDPEALKAAAENLKEFSGKFDLINDNFRNLKDYGQQLELLSPICGILLDLGVSSHQIAGLGGRGFSFQEPQGPLDMRMDPRTKLTAAEVLNTYSMKDLRRIFQEYGEEPEAKKIAGRVIKNRVAYAKASADQRPFEKVEDLLKIIPKMSGRIHPATKVFQALRIEVNDELGALQEFLPQAVAGLAKGGRLTIISFHSLEDRIIKRFFQDQAKDCICPPEFPVCGCQKKQLIKIITKKPVVPGPAEIRKNPRARSAKMRVAEKI